MGNKYVSIEIRTKKCKFINYSYLIIDKNTKEAVIVDPSWQIEKIVEQIDRHEAKLKKILLTHSHMDHVNLVDDLIERYNVDVHMSKEEADFYNYESQNLNLVLDGEIITIGDTEIKCILTSGHTKGSMCFLVEDEELFTGDTLFIEGCGRCDLLGGSPGDMFDSLQKIRRNVLDCARVYPAHSYGIKKGINLSEVERYNIYLSITNKKKFIDYRMRKQDVNTISFK